MQQYGVASDVLPTPSFAETAGAALGAPPAMSSPRQSFAEIAGAALGAPPAPTVLVPATSEISRREERHGPCLPRIEGNRNHLDLA